MNVSTVGTIIGTVLLGLAKAKSGDRNSYKPRKIESIYKLSKTKKAQIIELDLRSMHLKHLPDEIFDGFTNLKYLNFDDNQLTELPNSIGNLTNLAYLSLNHNQLTELPDSIGNLTSLKTLWLHNNQLTELPEWIGNLTTLEKLWLNYNQLTALPDSIGNLTNLKILDLPNNQLTELPEWIGNLTNLEKLLLYRNPWSKPVPKETILKMIRKRVKKDVINNIIEMNNSIPTKSNLRIR